MHDTLPGLKTMTWNLANENLESTRPISGDTDVNFQLSKDTLETMLKSMYSTRDQLSDPVSSILRFTLLFKHNFSLFCISVGIMTLHNRARHQYGV